MKADQNVISCVLKARIGLVQFAGRLRGQLAQLIAVRNMGKSPKDQIGSHGSISFIFGRFQPTVVWQQAWLSGQVAPGWVIQLHVPWDRPVSYLFD